MEALDAAIAIVWAWVPILVERTLLPFRGAVPLHRSRFRELCPSGRAGTGRAYLSRTLVRWCPSVQRGGPKQRRADWRRRFGRRAGIDALHPHAIADGAGQRHVNCGAPECNGGIRDTGGHSLADGARTDAIASSDS